MSAPGPIICELLAPRSARAEELAEIARTCAKNVGQPIQIKTVLCRVSLKEPTLTLHLPVELAASQHEVWCLACRLACFCPAARVSVLVRGENAFSEASKSRRRSRRRTA